MVTWGGSTAAAGLTDVIPAMAAATIMNARSKLATRTQSRIDRMGSFHWDFVDFADLQGCFPMVAGPLQSSHATNAAASPVWDYAIRLAWPLVMRTADKSACMGEPGQPARPERENVVENVNVAPGARYNAACLRQHA